MILMDNSHSQFYLCSSLLYLTLVIPAQSVEFAQAGHELSNALKGDGVNDGGVAELVASGTIALQLFSGIFIFNRSSVGSGSYNDRTAFCGKSC